MGKQTVVDSLTRAAVMANLRYVVDEALPIARELHGVSDPHVAALARKVMVFDELLKMVEADR